MQTKTDTLFSSKTKFVLLIALILVGIMISMGLCIPYAIFFCTSILLFFIIKNFENHQFIIGIALYLFIYFVYLYPYYFHGIQLSQYNKYQNWESYNKLGFLFLLFYCGMLYANIDDKQKTNIYANVKIRSTQWKKFFYILGLLLILILTIKQGHNVVGEINSYSTYKENLESINSMPLVCVLYLIFFIPILGDKSKRILVVIIILLIFFCISRGIRMVLAPIGTLIFAIFYENKISTKKLLVFFILAFIFLLIVNALKMNMELTISKAFSEGTEDFIISHQADNLYIGNVGISLVDEGIITFWDRIFLNIGFLLETIIPPTFIPASMKFPHIIGLHTSTGGGGLFLIGSYLMWGYVGVFIFGYILTKFICTCEKKGQSSIVTIIGITLCVFFPRWISYDFHLILRFSFLSILIYLFFNEWKKNTHYKHHPFCRRRRKIST